MSKILIAYYSLGGTTARVAESIAAGLRNENHRVDLYNIKDEPSPDLADYELLGIGTPAYYFRLPFNVVDYLNSLPNLDGFLSFTFVVHGTYRGDTGNIVRRALARKGAKEVGCIYCHGADFFLGYLKEGYFFSPDHPTAEDLTRAEEFGRQVAGTIAGQSYARPTDDPPLSIVYRLERLLLNRWLVEHVYSRFFKVDRVQCTAWKRSALRIRTSHSASPGVRLSRESRWVQETPFPTSPVSRSHWFHLFRLSQSTFLGMGQLQAKQNTLPSSFRTPPDPRTPFPWLLCRTNPSQTHRFWPCCYSVPFPPDSALPLPLSAPSLQQTFCDSRTLSFSFPYENAYTGLGPGTRHALRPAIVVTCEWFDQLGFD